MCIAGAAAIARAADEPKAAFDRLFGEEVRRVAATPDGADDLALAATLMEAARSRSDAGLLPILCEQVAALAIKDPAGHDLAVEAMTHLADAVPAQRLAALGRAADIRQRQYAQSRGEEKLAAAEALIHAIVTQGDAQMIAEQFDDALTSYRKAQGVASGVQSRNAAAVKGRVDRAVAAQVTHRQIQIARARLSQDKADAAAGRDLVRLYLVEMDDPAEARKYSFLAADESWSRNIRLAAASADSLPPEQCFAMGEWYRGLGDEARSDVAKAAMLRRAAVYYEQFLHQHRADDLVRTKATLASRKVQDDLARLNIADVALAPLVTANTAAKAGWVDALPLVDPATHGVGVTWNRAPGGEITSLDGSGSLAFPVQPTGSYDFDIRFAFQSGEHISLTLPVGRTSVTLQLGAPVGDTYYSGLARIRGADLSDPGNPTRSGPTNLVLYRPYTLSGRVAIRGADATITAALNGTAIVRWSGPVTALTPYMPDRWPGLIAAHTHASKITIHSARFRPADGDASAGAIAVNVAMPAAGAAPAAAEMPGALTPEQAAEVRKKLTMIRQRFRTWPYETQRQVILELQQSNYPEAHDLAQRLLDGEF